MEYNIMKVSHSKLDKVLEIKWRTKQPVLLLGYAGTGKSTHVRDFARKKAKELGLELWTKPTGFDPERHFLFLDIRASQLEPTDLIGIPKTNEGRTKWVLPEFWPEKGQGIIFFDEISHASEQTLRALYQIILDRHVGWDYELPEGIWVIGASNFDEEDPFLTEMPEPLRDRFSIIALEPPTKDEWLAYVGNRIDGRVASYIAKHPEDLHRRDSNKVVFPTPRSWERVGIAIKGVTDEETIMMLASADLGLEIATKFVRFIKEELDLPSWEELVRNPELLKNIEGYKMYSFMPFFTQWEKRKDVIKVLGYTLRYRPEVAVAIIKAVTNDSVDRQTLVAELVKEGFVDEIKKLTNELRVIENELSA